MGLFSIAIAVCILLITAHDRPFIGQKAVLLQVQPDAAVENTGQDLCCLTTTEPHAIPR